MTRFGKSQAIAIALFALIGLAAPFALAQSSGTVQGSQAGTQTEKQGRRWHGGHRGGRMFGGIFNRLNLTDEQKAQIKQLNQNFRTSTQPLRQQLQAKRQELRQASEGGTFNEALATQKLTEMASLEAKLMGERFKLRQEMLAVLTPEQKAQLDQMRQQFKARMAERAGSQSQ
jgi:protein CpxP